VCIVLQGKYLLWEYQASAVVCCACPAGSLPARCPVLPCSCHHLHSISYFSPFLLSLSYPPLYLSPPSPFSVLCPTFSFILSCHFLPHRQLSCCIKSTFFVFYFYILSFAAAVLDLLQTRHQTLRKLAVFTKSTQSVSGEQYSVFAKSFPCQLAGSCFTVQLALDTTG